jgi:hypothetical protein
MGRHLQTQENHYAVQRRSQPPSLSLSPNVHIAHDFFGPMLFRSSTTSTFSKSHLLVPHAPMLPTFFFILRSCASHAYHLPGPYIFRAHHTYPPVLQIVGVCTSILRASSPHVGHIPQTTAHQAYTPTCSNVFPRQTHKSSATEKKKTDRTDKKRI